MSPREPVQPGKFQGSTRPSGNVRPLNGSELLAIAKARHESARGAFRGRVAET